MSAKANRADRSARDRLLDAVVTEARGTGIGQRSLRQLAAAVGSSHRMLLYHFGSREGLLAAVATRLVAHHVELVARRPQRSTGPVSIPDAFEVHWERSLQEIEFSGPLMLELWVQAMGTESDSEARRQLLGASSIPPLREFWSHRGYSPEFASDLATLHRAAGRGLMVDLLLGGDPDDLRRCLILFGAAFSLASADAAAFERRERELAPPPRLQPATAYHGASRLSDETTGVRSGPGENESAREGLLDAIMRRVRGGIGTRSLRQLAEEIGTSHRMLLYHFGSRDGLLAEIAARLEDEQLDDMHTLISTDSTGNPNTARFLEFWDRVLDRVDLNGPLIFELASRALHGTPAPEAVRQMLIDCYRPALAGWWQQQGFGREFAGDLARLHVTIARGLMVDYLLGEAEPDGRRALGLFGGLFHLVGIGEGPSERAIERILPPRRRSRDVDHDIQLAGGTASS